MRGVLVAMALVLVPRTAPSSGGLQDEPPAAPGPTPASTASDRAPEPFTIRLEGFTAELRMVGVPASADGAIPRFWMSETEVPWDLYDVFMLRLDLSDAEKVNGVDAEARPTKAYGSPDRGFGHDGYAALGMSRLSAEKFCEWLSKKCGRVVRLPSEAEWEHAARGGARGDPAPGAAAKTLGDVAWYAANSDGKPHPVRTRQPNGYGLYDVLGNLAEWCAADPKEPKIRVARGGAFDSPEEQVGVTARRIETPAWNKTDPQFPKSRWWLSDASFVGFRVVCEEQHDAPR